MDLQLANKVFLVTGASGGLGYAAASALAAEGARVCLVSRNVEKLAKALAELPESDQHLCVPADLADGDQVQAAVDAVVGYYGQLDGAFISVGGPIPGSVCQISDEDWLASFNSVFLGALRVSRAVLTQNPAATLGYVLSVSAKTPLVDMAPSNGLRPGLAMLVKQLAGEIGPAGGRTFGLMPGLIKTDRINYLYDSKPASALAAAQANIPLGRLGEPSEFGQVAAFMMSPRASYLTGCVLPVDGGALPCL